RVNAGMEISHKERISAKGKNVLVIGGGDTGSDCVGTAHRQGALSVTQIEIMPKPPTGDNPDTPWPYWPVVLKTSSSHLEGCDRRWLLDTRKFIADEEGRVKEVEVEEVIWDKDPESGRMNLVHTGKTDTIKAELVLLAMGFTNPVPEGIIDTLGLKQDSRGNVMTDPAGQTSLKNVFAAGDVASGASLVVRCIASGRAAANGIHSYLADQSDKSE
ncbi:MAG: FAD-dependent oxidoreductase, partial [Duncaniella sp.]|nr:FAD-dependent oxidoreductase [Duncaniella sp.]